MTRNNRTNFNVLDNDDDALCCCQYVNERGQRSHLAGLLCDCQEVDDAFDRFCRGSLSSTTVPDSSTTLGCILDVVEDRLRIPWRGGARKVPLDAALPWLMVPSMIWLSSLGPWMTLAAQGVAVPAVFWAAYRACLKRWRPRTRFFASWSCATAACLLGVYQADVVGLFWAHPKTVSPWENLCLMVSLAGALWSLFRMRSSPPAPPNSGKVGDTATTTLCRICQMEVRDRDHHCIWLNACVSASNLGHFLAFLAFISTALLQAGLIFLTSCCGWVRQVRILPGLPVLVPTGCSEFNLHYQGHPGLAFAAGVHCWCLCIPVTSLLIYKACSAFIVKRVQLR